MHSSHRSVCKLLAFRGEKPGKPSAKQNVSLRRYSVSRPNPVDINPSYYPGTPYITTVQPNTTCTSSAE